MGKVALAVLAAALAASPGGDVPPSIPGVRMPTDGAPPAELADPRAPPPGPAFVWIDGHWQWTEGRWAWVPGQWAEPPGRPPYAWVPARWTSDARGWTFHEPCWVPTSGNPSTVHEPVPVAHAFASSSPPPLLVESPGTAPSRDAVWIPGFWSWTGSRFAWVMGTWSAPRPGMRWVEGFWKPERGGFRWQPGRWKRA
jgi:WXXGXW repeat (2 copies)